MQNLTTGAADRAMASMSVTEARRSASEISDMAETSDNDRSASTAASEPSSGVELTKKGEAYVARANTAVEAGNVFFLTLAKGHRTSIAAMIERLINLLADLDDDPDLEPSLAGWQGVTDDREDDPAEGPEETGWREGGECHVSRSLLEARRATI